MTRMLAVERFDPRFIKDQLMEFGAVSVPLATKEAVQELLERAQTYSFDPNIGVQTRYESNDPVLRRFGDALSRLVNGPLQDCLNFCFEEKPLFESIAINRYMPYGSFNVHADTRYGLITCVLRLNEDGRTFYASPSGVEENFVSTRRKLDTTPGNVIFMRAPGFNGTANYIYHQVTSAPKLGYSAIFLNSLAA